MVEELWAENVRSAHRERYGENAAGWLEEYHENQIRAHEATLGALIAHHRVEAERYRRMLFEDDIPGPVLRLAPGMAEVVS
jgi:hypothetical protein